MLTPPALCSSEGRGVAKRRIFLSVVAGFWAEVANKFVPLAILYLARLRLGVTGFGFSQFGMTLVDLFLPLVGFGYQNLTAIEIGRARGDRAVVRQVMSDVLALKLIHAAVALSAMLGAVALIPSYRPYLGIVLASSFVLFSAAFDMTSVHIGTQRMFSVSVLSTVARLASLAAIVLLVRGDGDAVVYAVLSLGAGSLVSLGTFVLSVRRYGLSGPRWGLLAGWFRKSAPFALVFAFMVAIDRFDMLLVERFFGVDGAGIYAAPWRMAHALMPVIGTIAVVFLSELIPIGDSAEFTRHVELGLWAVLAVIVPIAGGVWFVSADLLRLITTDVTPEAATVLCTLVCGVAVQTLFTVFGLQILLLRERIRTLNLVLAGGAAVGVAAGTWLAPRFGLVGIACASLLVKSLVGITVMVCARPFLSAMPWPAFARTLLPASIMVVGLRTMALHGLAENVCAGIAIYGPALAAFNPRKSAWVLKEMRVRLGIGRK